MATFLVLALLTLLSRIAAEPNPLDPALTHGACYGAPAFVLHGFLPCGNGVVGQHSCCWHGDFCLTNGACRGVHGDSNVTYLAGCTDQWYENPRCPNKTSGDAWVALGYCGDESHRWEVCEQPGHPASLAPAAPCSCPADQSQQTIGLVAIGSVISASALLPETIGGTMSFVEPFGPVVQTRAITLSGLGEHATITTTVIWKTTPVTETVTADASTVTTVETPEVPSSPGQTGPGQTVDPGEITSSSGPANFTSPSPNTPSATSTPSPDTAPLGSILGASLGSVLALLVLVVLLVRRQRAKRAAAGAAGCASGPFDAESASKSESSGLMPVGPAGSPVSGQPPADLLSPLSTASELETHPSSPWSLRSELEGEGHGLGELRGMEGLGGLGGRQAASEVGQATSQAGQAANQPTTQPGQMSWQIAELPS